MTNLAPSVKQKAVSQLVQPTVGGQPGAETSHTAESAEAPSGAEDGSPVVNEDLAQLVMVRANVRPVKVVSLRDVQEYLAELEPIVQHGNTSALVWWCIGCGPVAWATDLALSYALAKRSCSSNPYIPHLITLLCFLIALSGVVVAWSRNKKLSDGAPAEHAMDRSYFQLLFGMVFSAAFALLVVAGAVPPWIATMCK